MSPPGPAPERFRVATWNLNSLRPRLAAVARFLERVAPDVVCLQETKTPHLSVEAVKLLSRHGYSAVHVGGPSYNGVAVVARHPIGDVQRSGDFGVDDLDREPRLISCVVTAPTPVRVVSMYVPHGRLLDHWHYRYKLRFLEAVAERVRLWLLEDGEVIVAGDVNVAPTDSDVYRPSAFVGSVYVSPLERDALEQVLRVGLVDVDVARWGAGARRFTWWNHGRGYPSDLGMRLDLIAADRHLAARLDTTWIDHTERSMPAASDHAALIADFHLPDTRPS